MAKTKSSYTGKSFGNKNGNSPPWRSVFQKISKHDMLHYASIKISLQFPFCYCNFLREVLVCFYR